MISTRSLPVAAIFIALATASVTGCGSGSGGGSATPPVPSGPPPAAILVTGATYQYTGTENVAIVYAAPSVTNVNSSGSYTYASNETIAAAGNGAPAPFDVNRVTAYTVTQPPAAGEQLIAQTSDSFENQTFAGATETLTLAGTKAVTTGIDLDAGLRLGGGPFNESATSSTAYTLANVLGVYPLQSGALITEPLARTVAATTTDANGGGVNGGGNTTTTAFNNDGSFTRTMTAVDGSSTQQQTVNSNATAQQTITQSTGSVKVNAVGLPATSGGSTSIPVTVTTNGTPQTYAAADWYPGFGSPLLPLATSTRIVKGPASLPAACAASSAAPPVIEVDSATATLDPLGSYATTAAQNFLANGIEFCRLQTSVTANYALTTGALTSTTTTTLAESLTGSNQTITGVRRVTP